MQPPCQLPLKLLLDLMAFELWTPLIVQWTKMSTRDGNFGHTRLNLPLKPWKETLRRPRSPSCTIGLMVKVFPKLKDGRTAIFSSNSQIMMHWKTKQASTL